MDLSYQHRSKGWKFYFAPLAKVDHMHRADIKALRRVWVTYGQAHLPLIDKYCKKKQLEIVFQNLKGGPGIKIPFPLRGFVYIGNFHLMHLCALATLFGLLISLLRASFGWWVFTLIFFLLTWKYAYQFVRWNFDMEPKSAFWFWCKIKYQTNLSFIQGGLKGFAKYKVLCIEPSF
jgi:hypothetical protein